MSALGPVHVFTFKAGLLSRVAHDLRLSAQGGTVEVDGDAIRAEVPLAGLRVDGVMKKGRLDPAGLSPKDQASVARTATQELLQVGRHPVARFEGRREAGFVRGRLSFRGRSVSVELPVRGARIVGEIQPSAWGIAPYKALMGAIQLQDRVRLEIDLPG